MERSRLNKYIPLVLLVLLAQVVQSQSCYIDYIDPPDHEFSISGGSIYVTVHTYPYNCGPDLDFPSWLNMYLVSEETYNIECDENSGTCKRTAWISVGDDGIYIVQQGTSLDGGSIGGPNAEYELSICYNTSPGTLTNQASADGGDCSSHHYQWQMSTNGTYFTDISGATNLTYTPGNLTATRYYRRMVSDYADEAYSNVLQVNVSSQTISGGTISGNQTIFYNTEASIIINTQSPTGSSFTCQWQKYPSGASSWSTIPGATNLTYDPPTLTITTKYRRVATLAGDCASDSSNTITKTVRPALAIPDTSKNYILVIEPNMANDSVEYLDDADSVRASIQYFDGLGRLAQQTQVSGSPSKSDIVIPVFYDEFGRQSIKYLPYTEPNNSGSFVSAAISEQGTFYNDSLYFPNEKAYSKTVFESSPLNRVLQQGAPGKVWQPSTSASADSGHTIKYEYLTNDAEDVWIWKVTGNNLKNEEGESVGSHYYYPANTLFKTVIKDENWKGNGSLHTSEEFKDMQGNVVLKRGYVLEGSDTVKVETYYVYDDFNLLRYVLPPKSLKYLISSNTLTPDSARIRNLCYYYKYDSRRRLIRNQLPGADSVLMVYDKRDRLVLTQDGNLRKNVSNTDLKQWQFTKYDQLNRPVMTGIYTHSTVLNQAGMQAYFDTIQDGSGYQQYETYNEGSGNIYYYKNVSFPTSISDSCVNYVTYYDNYNFDDNAIRGYSNGVAYCQSINTTDYPVSEITTQVVGMITGTKTRILNRDGAMTGSEMALSINMYDKKGRIVRSLSQNHMGGEDLISYKYDFIGNVLKSQQVHRLKNATTPSEIKLNKIFSYDHFGRLLSIDQEIIYGGTSKGTTRIAEMSYNELGQLQSKTLKGGTSNYLLQTVDYKYNIRGWLTSINNGTLSGTDLFAMDLSYETIPTGTGAPATEKQFNGNISSVLWKTSGDTDTKAYGYTYDKLNRLKGGDYATKSSGGDWTNTNAFDEKDLTYDDNGNILTLMRYDTTGSLIDNLTYVYGQKNALQSVTDSVGKMGEYDFPGTANQANAYTYDKNGNMYFDVAKGITNTSYNFMNLPQVITFSTNGSLNYSYTAGGNKLRKKKVDSSTTYRHYVNGFEYDEKPQGSYALNLIHNEEGVVMFNSGNQTFDYMPIIKDHLGNTRVVVKCVSGQPTAEQKSNYFPFGLLQSGTTNDNIKYLYNGKEVQDEMFNSKHLDWYDYGARMYDPQLGRWTTMDNKAEKYVSTSPYTYCLNNPVIFIDPDGNEVYYSQDGTRLGQVGTNTDVRVVNSTITNTQATTHIQNSNTETLNSSSLAYASYFTTVADVTNDAALQTFTNNGDNCRDAAVAQLSDAGVTQTGPDNAINTKVDAGSTLTADPIGGSILVQTQLNNGDPVMVGVEETKADGTSPDSGNTNSATGHFVVIRSSTVSADGTVTFNYLDNASTSLGKNANNNFTLNTTTGAMQDNTIPQRQSYVTYDVTEVRKNQ